MGSLPVPNVQSLSAASHAAADVPHRYIRPDLDTHPVAASDAAVDIPIIDFGRLRDPKSHLHESSKLHLACQNWGFFQLINHNVPTQVVEKIRFDVLRFFQLPLAEKRQVAQAAGDLQGYGQLFVVSEEQKLDWADMLYLNTQPDTERAMRFWPTQPPSFSVALDNYSSELKNLAECLMEIMAKNLGLGMDVVTEKFKVGIQSIRFNYYPPCAQAHKVLGFSQHSDSDLITFVLQVNQVQGLQIKRRGEWVPVRAHHGAFIVNLGDIFEIYSNGRYKSIEHRVVVNTEMERLSIATFHSPKSDAVIGPLQEMIGGSGAKYRSVDHESFMKLFFSSKLDGKSFLDSMRCES
ncbi:2-oxoglutarate-dependent dioxygenase 11-like [Zingiber officinale]|uniref:2-oxoglutarate-dependent dioxygenase 11-like n=1 Tax=Zingiber officinale TaxID=94328 RepID=UPI001C4C501A|nr:2-oxoglutarate-dependent dioxygenase 11-like [Zingiber officinale]